MAKAICLEVLNKIQENLGEAKTAVGSITALSGLNLLIFNTMNEVLQELSIDYNLQGLETDITLTMVTNVGTYTNAATLLQFDKDSFRYNNQKALPYYTPQRFDREFPIQTATGIPKLVTLWKGYFRPFPVPQASESGKIINGRGWGVATPYSTASASGTSFVPEGFDLTLLANWVTFKVLSYKQNPEAQVYYAKVFGTKDMEGQLDKFKRIFGSPQILDESIMVEPMENSRQYGTVQPPIIG